MAKTVKYQKGQIVAALDIGSHKIACFIGRVLNDGGAIEVLGVGYQASRGIKNGVISDLGQAEVTIRQAVHAAENMAAQATGGYPLREVIVNVPPVLATSRFLQTDVDIGSRVIGENDIRRALAKAQEDVLSTDYELIHTIPVSFSIDGKDGIKSPLGMSAESLGAGIHIVAGELNALENMSTSIGRSHLDISAFCVAPYAAGLGCLVEDEMDLGCTVIDMGAGMTSCAVFQDGHMIYTGAVPIGGHHVTSDIAKGVLCSLSDAERIKTLYGSAAATVSDDSELIEVTPLGESAGAASHITRTFLIGIIQPRIEEILELIKAKLNDADLGKALGRRVVLTGGACQLPGLRDLAQLVLDKQVRIGRPIRLNSLPDAVSGAPFATTAGMLTYATQRQNEMPAEIMASVEPGSLWERLIYWARETW